jgi:hypothetical protein
MAGAGYKLFNTGDVLTAAQVNTYLQEQVVMVFANATARTTALSGVLAEGMVTYLKDTDALEIYSGAAWVGYGSGDITGVTAGTGISGGGTSGTVTITNSMATEITAAGDIIVGTGSGTFDNLPIGTTGQILTADTTVSPYKVKWASPASSGGMTSIASGTLSSTSTLISSIPTTYNNLVLYIDGWSLSSDGWGLWIRLNDDSTANRYYQDDAFADVSTPTSFNANHIKISRDNYGVTSSGKQFTYVVIPWYANTTSWKTLQYYSISQGTTDSTQFVAKSGNGLYNQTSAITSLRITNGAGATQSGNYALYGVK